MKPKYPCPACGFIVFEEPIGSYDICPICGWEDDHVQLKHPTLIGGANKNSLYERQQTWIKKMPLDVKEYKDFKRADKWRPLTAEECTPQSAEPQTGLEYFNTAGEDNPKYYWE
jgi:uncharacterized Zn finger protein (UPF0148 family)